MFRMQLISSYGWQYSTLTAKQLHSWYVDIYYVYLFDEKAGCLFDLNSVWNPIEIESNAFISQLLQVS